MIAIAVYCVYSFIVIGFDELFSLWAATQAEHGELLVFSLNRAVKVTPATARYIWWVLDFKGEFACCWYNVPFTHKVTSLLLTGVKL